MTRTGRLTDRASPRLLLRIVIGVMAVAFVSAVALHPGPAVAEEMEPDKGDLIKSLLPTVVNIVTSKVEAASPPPVSASAPTPPGVPFGSSPGALPKPPPLNPNGPTTVKSYVGSGFIIDPDGLIVTNYHVVEDSFKILITLSDGSRFIGKTLSASRLADIALVKIDAGRKLMAAQWGNSDSVQVGDQVFVVGDPFGIGLSVSAGIVSGLNRDIQNSPYDELIQTDATINHGNSGGPLFNMRGHVVGVNSAIISPTSGSVGLGFAIPSRSAQFVIKRLQTYGWVRPAWVGLKLQLVTPDIAQALGMQQAEGSIVSWVRPDGPSFKAGLEVGDVLLTFNGRRPTDDRALLRDIAESDVGAPVRFGILRAGKPREIEVTTGQWPRNQWDALDAPLKTDRPKIAIPPDLGLTLAPLLPADRTKLDLTTYKEGVLISAVPKNSDAWERGVQAGDVVLRVQDKPVFSKADIVASVAAERAAKRRYVLLLIWPKVRTVPGPKWVALQAGPDGD